MPFVFEETGIEGLIKIVQKQFFDERGYFVELYKKSDFMKNNIKEDFLQDNFSYSKKGVLRGIHFQKEPYGQSKIVNCLKGKILDVAVDLRKNSATYGKWFSQILSPENKISMYIPVGFGHGFYSLEDENLVLYKTSSEYNAESDSGIIWDDTDLKIDWQLIGEPIISQKDRSLKKFKDI